MVNHTYNDCPPPIRRSGRTNWMINQLCDVVANGQPKSMVFGHSENFTLNHLKPMIINELKKRGIKIDSVSKYKIIAEESIILLSSMSTKKESLRGYRGFGIFIDHYADGEI